MKPQSELDQLKFFARVWNRLEACEVGSTGSSSQLARMREHQFAQIWLDWLEAGADKRTIATFIDSKNEALRRGA